MNGYLALGIVAGAAVSIAGALETSAIVEARASVAVLQTRVADLEKFARASRLAGGRTSPAIEKPDAKFFGGKSADYTHDNRVGVKDHFSYPFPEVQDTNDFDKDFVKDENSDSGEWKAQSQYDSIRSKVASARKVADMAKRKLAEEEKELEAKQALERKGEAEAEKRKAIAAAAENAVERTKAKADESKADVEKAQQLQTSEEMDLKECKRQLSEAKARLDKLMAEKQAAERTREAQVAARARAESGRLEEEKERTSGERARLDERVAAMETRLKNTKTELEAATKALRKFRRSADTGQGQNGGVYNRVDTRSGAHAALPGVIVVLALAGVVAVP